MQSKQKFKKIVSAVIIGGVVLSFGTSALAASDIQPTAPKQVYCEKASQGKHHFEKRLAELVSQKIITQEQADKWSKFHQEKRVERKAEREADRDKFKNMTKEERLEYWKQKKSKRLDEVVKEGIITKEQADQIKNMYQQKFNKQ